MQNIRGILFILLVVGVVSGVWIIGWCKATIDECERASRPSIFYAEDDPDALLDEPDQDALTSIEESEPL